MAFEVSSAREKKLQETTAEKSKEKEFEEQRDRWDQNGLDKLVLYLSNGNNTQIVKFSRMGLIQALITVVKNDMRKGQNKSQRKAALVAQEQITLELAKRIQKGEDVSNIDCDDDNKTNRAIVALGLLSKISLTGCIESRGQVNIFKSSYDENNGTNYLVSLTNISNTKDPILDVERYQSCLAITYLYLPTLPEARKFEAICIPAIKEMLNSKDCKTLESVLQSIAFVVKFPRFFLSFVPSFIFFIIFFSYIYFSYIYFSCCLLISIYKFYYERWNCKTNGKYFPKPRDVFGSSRKGISKKY
jgi:hypothetical protein